MIALPASGRVYLACWVTDMRKGMTGQPRAALLAQPVAVAAGPCSER